MSRTKGNKAQTIMSQKRSQTDLAAIKRSDAAEQICAIDITWLNKFSDWARKLESGQVSRTRFAEEMGMDYPTACGRWYRLCKRRLLATVRGRYLAGLITRDEYQQLKAVVNG